MIVVVGQQDLDLEFLEIPADFTVFLVQQFKQFRIIVLRQFIDFT